MKNIKIDAIIFDLTRTLIDISKSQEYVIEITVNNYLQKTAVTQSEIQLIKGVIGYNNEWDTTYAIVRLIKKRVPLQHWEKEAQKMLPIDRTQKLFKELYAMFQTCYLGGELFKKLENGNPPFPYDPGLMTYEKSFASKDLIASLKKKEYKLGIATGCPTAEALLMLAQIGLLGENYFEKQFVVGRDDVSYDKPDPAPLLEAKRRLKANNPIFIGDSISDAQSSRRANMPFILVANQVPGVYKDTLIDQIIQLFL